MLIINDVSGWRRFRGDQAGLGKAQWDPVPEWGQLLATMKVVDSCINVIFKSHCVFLRHRFSLRRLILKQTFVLYYYTCTLEESPPTLDVSQMVYSRVSAKWTVTPAVVTSDQCWSNDPHGRTDCLFRIGAKRPELPSQAEKHRNLLFFFFLQDFPDLDLMLKKRRVGTHSCCAAVAPLCCRKGQRKVNKCARSTQISFTFWLFARPF